MKKNGFTLIELITTFAIASVIIVLLINIVLSVESVYSSANIETQLYLDQGNLSNVINSKFRDGSLVNYSSCGEDCYDFYFLQGDNARLTVDSNKITFGNYTYNKNQFTEIGQMDLTHENGLLVIKIPITSNLYPNTPFGVTVIYPY